MYHPNALKSLRIGKRHNSNFQISQNGVIFFILTFINSAKKELLL